MGEAPKSSGSNANAQNAVSKRTYVRPRTLDVFSRRTMEYNKDSPYRAAADRAFSIYADMPKVGTSKEVRYRNIDRINKARDRMMAKAEAVWEGTHPPVSWNDAYKNGDIVKFLDDWNDKMKRGGTRVVARR